jgi:hypothetical protein
VKKSAPALALSIFAFFLQACLQDPVSVSDGDEMEIRLHVTGGFAGADYVVFLNGAGSGGARKFCRRV